MKEFNPLDQAPPSRHSSQEILQCRGRSPKRRKNKKKAQEPIVYFDSDADDECDVDWGNFYITLGWGDDLDKIMY